MISVAASAVTSSTSRAAATRRSACLYYSGASMSSISSPLSLSAALPRHRHLMAQLPALVMGRTGSSAARRRITTSRNSSSAGRSARRSYSSSTGSGSGKKSSSSSSSPRGFSFSTVAKDHPFAFQLMVATGKTSAADLIVQMVAERKDLDQVDWKRNGIFVVFGFAYLGGFQYWLMVNKYRQWFPTMDRFAKLPFREKLGDAAGMLDAAKMVLFDIVVHLPMLYFPTYYTVKEFVYGATWNPLDWVKDGVAKYSRNLEEDLTAMVQLWGPSDCVQFVLPVHVRMPFRHIVSFFWTAYVSFTRGSLDPAEAAVEGVAVDSDHGDDSSPPPPRK